MRRKDYIESPEHWKEMYKNPDLKDTWRTIDKVPIEKIKIDKSLFAFQNDIDHSNVLYMLINFDQEVWIPILVNENYYLLDGQHRLAVAKQLCLKYIDVVVQCNDYRMPKRARNTGKYNGKRRSS